MYVTFLLFKLIHLLQFKFTSSDGIAIDVRIFSGSLDLYVAVRRVDRATPFQPITGGNFYFINFGFD